MCGVLGMATRIMHKMKFEQRLRQSSILGGLALALAVITPCPSARANVYATDVKVNGGFTNITAATGAVVSISYILNEPATLGVTVNILFESNSLRALSFPAGGPGALRGTNSVAWDGLDYSSNNLPGGTYSIAVTAAASGFTNWTQTSVDTNAGNYVWQGEGIAVDRNAASPYYGRVFVGNAVAGPGTNVGDGVGILKLNADASPAEESPTNWLTTGDHAWAGDGFSPWKIEISADDYVYIDDFSTLVQGQGEGLVYRWDPTLSTNSQLAVLQTNNWGSEGSATLSGLAIFGTGTNTEIWTTDNRIYLGTPNGSEGIVRYDVTTNGTCATNDTGTTIVGVANSPGTNLDQSPYDVALDGSHNIYAIQNIDNSGDPSQRVFQFPAYNPGTNGGVAEPNALWAVGGGDDGYAQAYGIAVDQTARYVAVAFLGLTNGNTKVLSATNGALVADLDTNYQGVAYFDTDCAWDAVGNVYFIKVYTDTTTPGTWRVFSPPGTNQATTLAVAKVQINGAAPPPPPQITRITETGGVVTITFTAGSNQPPSAFEVLGASLAGGPYSPVSGATITSQSPGVFQATFPSSAGSQFYRIEVLSGVAPRITSLTVTGQTVSIDFTAAPTDYPWAFTLQGAAVPSGPYTDISGASASSLGSGAFGFTTAVNGPSRFYRVRR